MIKWIYDSGWSNVVYYAFHVLGFTAVLLFNLWYAKKYKISKKQALLTTVIVYSITYVWIYILCWAETGFRVFGGNNIVRGFVYIPLIAYPVSRLLKIKWGRMCDFIAPCVCLSHGVSHIGCIFAGCCKGYPSSFGIYHPVTGETLFPVQLVEAITALAVMAIVYYFSRKKKFEADGCSYALMLILFGFTRFLLEFARDNEKIWLGCSSLAFHALFMGAVGLIAIVIVNQKNRLRMRRNNKRRM